LLTQQKRLKDALLYREQAEEEKEKNTSRSHVICLARDNPSPPSLLAREEVYARRDIEVRGSGAVFFDTLLR